jgi:hypothetical protein
VEVQDVEKEKDPASLNEEAEVAEESIQESIKQ